MKPTDCYTLLGVSRYASDDSVRRAFRSRLQAVHPDHNPADLQAAARTRDLVEAYACIRSARTPAAAPLEPARPDSAVWPASRLPLGRVQAVALVICLIAVTAAVASLLVLNAPPVYSAHLIDQDWLVVSPVMADTVEPSVFDLRQWHACRLSNLSFGAHWSTLATSRLPI